MASLATQGSNREPVSAGPTHRRPARAAGAINSASRGHVPVEATIRSRERDHKPTGPLDLETALPTMKSVHPAGGTHMRAVKPDVVGPRRGTPAAT